MGNFEIIKVSQFYCEYLRKFDDKVYFNSNTKSTRPYIGVLFDIDGIKFFAPLSSPKPKHRIMRSMMDFIKIDDGRLGVINLNNMIPVLENHYQKLDLDKTPETKAELEYFTLLKKQLQWLNSHIIQIRKKSLKLYNMYKSNKLPENIKLRCCDFNLLLSKCEEYNKVRM